VLSDGRDTDSGMNMSQLLDYIGASGEESGRSIKVFTIAFGDDADEEILRNIAESTGGRMYKGDPASIRDVYIEIETFF
jgi:Ca-activated chloride channel family protein